MGRCEGDLIVIVQLGNHKKRKKDVVGIVGGSNDLNGDAIGDGYVWLGCAKFIGGGENFGHFNRDGSGALTFQRAQGGLPEMVAGSFATLIRKPADWGDNAAFLGVSLDALIGGGGETIKSKIIRANQINRIAAEKYCRSKLLEVLAEDGMLQGLVNQACETLRRDMPRLKLRPNGNVDSLGVSVTGSRVKVERASPSPISAEAGAEQKEAESKNTDLSFSASPTPRSRPDMMHVKASPSPISAKVGTELSFSASPTPKKLAATLLNMLTASPTPANPVKTIDTDFQEVFELFSDSRQIEDEITQHSCQFKMSFQNQTLQIDATPFFRKYKKSEQPQIPTKSQTITYRYNLPSYDTSQIQLRFSKKVNYDTFMEKLDGFLDKLRKSNIIITEDVETAKQSLKINPEFVTPVTETPGFVSSVLSS